MQGRDQDSLDKELFLAVVREALGRHEPLIHVPDYPAIKTTLPRHREKVRTVQARIEARKTMLVNQLINTATTAGWRVSCVASDEEAGLTIGDIAKTTGVRRAIRTNEDILRRVNVDAALRKVRVTPTVLASGRQRRRGELRSLALRADLGISGVDYAVAETGTCVTVPRKGVARMTTLLPATLITVVETVKIVENIDDLLAMWRMENLRTRGRMPNYMTLISGPSKTADIELTLTTGMHGPGRAHLILVP